MGNTARDVPADQVDRPDRRTVLRTLVAGGALAAVGLPVAAASQGGTVSGRVAAARSRALPARRGTAARQTGPAARPSGDAAARPSGDAAAARQTGPAERQTGPAPRPSGDAAPAPTPVGGVSATQRRAPGALSSPASTTVEVRPGSSVPKPVLRRLGGPAPLPEDRDFRLHLLRRTTYGVTAALLADVDDAGGTTSWLSRQLDPATLPDPVCDAVLPRFPLATATAPWCFAHLSRGSYLANQDLVRATLSRQVWSQRQLQEVMVEFWSNHLNITAPSGEAWATKGTDDREVVRAHALGRFDDMLVASLHSPAMLMYLSNATSTRVLPNENHGRELLELHTVGVDAGYGQAGVVDSARVLTGLTVWRPTDRGATPDAFGTFRYRADWHHTGPVRVLGWSHPNNDPAGGSAVAESYARYLATHPATAARLARKLAVRFVSDDPPASLVDALVSVYLEHETAIVPVLWALFTSSEFAAAAGRKQRRPAEDVVATMRALGVTPDPASTDSTAIRNVLAGLVGMGNAPLGWHPPDGYPDVAGAWSGAGTTLGRWNLHAALASGRLTSGLTWPPLVPWLLGPQVPRTRGALVDALTDRLLPAGTLSPAHRTALVAFLGADGPVQPADTAGMFPLLVSMVLDSPGWCVR